MIKVTMRCDKCGAASEFIIPTGWEGRAALTSAKCGCGGAKFDVIQEEVPDDAAHNV